MKTFGWNGAILGIAMFMLAGCLTGCEDSGGDDGDKGLGDVGSNNPDVYAAVGDSITAGGNRGGDPYPPRLAAMTGKTVINHGVGGESTGAALNRIGSILANDKPGAMLILLGANDLIQGGSMNDAVANLRSIIQLAKANNTIPVVATLLPMRNVHALWAGGARELSARIRDLASSESARLVDLEAEFGSREGLLLDDGLHPNDAGNQLIALAFRDAL